MYSITERLDGVFEGMYYLQDGREYFHESSRDSAVAMMLVCADIGNHQKITEADIDFYRVKEVECPPQVKVMVERVSVPMQGVAQERANLVRGEILGLCTDSMAVAYDGDSRTSTYYADGVKVAVIHEDAVQKASRPK